MGERDLGESPASRLLRWSYVLGAGALYAAMAYAAWYWGSELFPLHR